MFWTHQHPPVCSRYTDTDTAPAWTLWVTTVPLFHSLLLEIEETCEYQCFEELQRNLNCTETDLPTKLLLAWPLCWWGSGRTRGHPHCSQPFISSKSRIRRILNILNPTSARFSPGDILLLLQAAAPVPSVRNEREFVTELRNPWVHLGIVFGR